MEPGCYVCHFTAHLLIYSAGKREIEILLKGSAWRFAALRFDATTVTKELKHHISLLAQLRSAIGWSYTIRAWETNPFTDLWKLPTDTSDSICVSVQVQHQLFSKFLLNVLTIPLIYFHFVLIACKLNANTGKITCYCCGFTGFRHTFKFPGKGVKY